MNTDEKIDALCDGFQQLTAKVTEVTDPKRTAPTGGLRKTIAGIVAAVVIAAIVGIAGLFLGYGSRLTTLEAQAKTAPTSERVAVVETKVETLGKDVEKIKQGVEASNSKLDKQSGEMQAIMRRLNVRPPRPATGEDHD